MSIQTPITKLFGIKHPILLAGMNVAAGPELAAAVTNAGGMGVIGGMSYSPKTLREVIHELKADLKDKNAPFGIDLLLPQVGGNARKTNYDYTKGNLDALVDVVIEEKAALFVSAVGVPPKHVVEKLHKAGIPVANMVGHVKHVERALEVGVDIIVAQGGEGGGHTGDIPTFLLLPAIADIIKGRKSSLTGDDILLIGAGGVYDGKTLAGALSLGASAVWVGTRFVCAEEAGAPKAHQQSIIDSDWGGTERTLIYTGRPLRVRAVPYVKDWNENRQQEIKELTAKGVIPAVWDGEKNGVDVDRSYLMGVVSAVIKDIKPAKQIVDEMITEAIEYLTKSSSYIVNKAKL